MKETAKVRILRHLADAGRSLAIHEFQIPGVSQNSVGSRLPELAREGAVIGRIRPGTNFKEWEIRFRLELAG